MKYLIKLDDGKYLLKFGKYMIYRRDENEKDECLKTRKQLEHCIELLKKTTINNYQIIEIED